MRNNILELLILEELGKELKEISARPSPWTQGSSPQGQVRKAQDMQVTLAEKLGDFQGMAQDSFDK